MVRPANGKAEGLGAIGLVEDLAVVESEVVREVRWGHHLSYCGHELLHEHVFDVVYSLDVTLAHHFKVCEDHDEVCFRYCDELVVGGEGLGDLLSLLLQGPRLLGQKGVDEDRWNLRRVLYRGENMINRPSPLPFSSTLTAIPSSPLFSSLFSLILPYLRRMLR